MRTVFLDLLTRATRLPVNNLWSSLLAEWLAEIPEFIAIGIRLLHAGPVPGLRFELVKPVSEDTFHGMTDWANAFESGFDAIAGEKPAATGLSGNGSPVLAHIAPFVFRQTGCGDLTIMTQPLGAKEQMEWMRFTERLADLLFSRHLNSPRTQTSEFDDPKTVIEFLHEMQRLFAKEPQVWAHKLPMKAPIEALFAENEAYLGTFLSRLQAVFDIETAFVLQRVTDEHTHILISGGIDEEHSARQNADAKYHAIPAEIFEMLELLCEHDQFCSLPDAKLTILSTRRQSGISKDTRPITHSYPCQVAGLTYGHLGVSTNRSPAPGPFARLMALITNHLGFWFAHLYQLRKEAEHAHLLKQVNMTFNVITGCLDVEGIFDQLCGSPGDQRLGDFGEHRGNLETLFGQKHGAVAIFSPLTHELEIVRHFGNPPQGFDLKKAVVEAGIIRDYIADGSAYRAPAGDSEQPIRFVFPLSPTPQVGTSGDDIFHQRSLGGVILYNSPENHLMSDDILDLLIFLLNGFSAALRVAYNYQEKLETIHALEGLIARLDDQDKLLTEMIDIIRRLLKVNRISFLTIGADGKTLSIQKGYGLPAGIAESMHIPIGEGISGYVAKTGETLRMDNIEEAETKFKRRSLEHYFNRSLLSVPLVSTTIDGETKVLGVINVNNKANGLTFNQQDQQMLESIAHLVVAALTNMSLMKAQHENDLLQVQLNSARDVQMSLLPKCFSNIPPQIGMYGRSVPARQIGGDFYDGLALADGRWLAAIGDVSGKGMPAAILMATTRIILRTVVQDTYEPSRILERVHEQLGRELDEYFFVTMQVVAIDPVTGVAEMVSAGHGPLLAHLGGTLTQLECKSGFPLGVGGSQVTFDSVKFKLQAGDRLLFFTDGLPEEYDPRHEMFGLARTHELFNALHTLSAKDLVEHIFAAADEWRSGGEAHDDLTVLAVTYSGVMT